MLDEAILAAVSFGLIPKLSKWIAEPFKEPKEKARISVATSAVIEERPRIFRPSNFEEYIGQERAKSQLKAYISGTKSRGKVFPHIMIHGNAGCGKTTLARLIAKELDVSFVEIVASDIIFAEDILSQLRKLQKHGILFVDEVHGLKREVVEGCYPIMEDGTYKDFIIAPFTFMGATTELGEILKTRRPFFDRFKIVIELEQYTNEEIERLVKQYKSKIFPNDTIMEGCYKVIAENSRGTPRMSVRLLESTIYLNGNVKQALQNFSIIDKGYNLKDLKTLQYIASNDKGVGLQGISSYLAIPAESYIYDIEPYLLQNNLLVRTGRGRKITVEGQKMIKVLELTNKGGI
jgi:Holliday junction DNA helicase RuvB